MNKEKIIFNLPKDIKDEFKQTCDVLGLSMSAVLIMRITEFIKQSKQKPEGK